MLRYLAHVDATEAQVTGRRLRIFVAEVSTASMTTRLYSLLAYSYAEAGEEADLVGAESQFDYHWRAAHRARHLERARDSGGIPALTP